MFNTKIWLYLPASVGGGDYSVNIYFQDSSKSSFLNINDIITDTAQNNYKIVQISTPFNDGDSATLHYLTSDVLPVEDSDYNSTVNTPNVLNPEPAYRISGILYESYGIDSTNYEYTARFYPNDTAIASQAIIGDSIVDASGKEFQITYLPPGKFEDAEPIKIKEVEPQGKSPTEGDVTLYRATSIYNFFQGTELTDPARNAIQTRDIKKIDSILISDAPLNGKQYVRKDADWAEIVITPTSGTNIGTGEGAVFASLTDGDLQFRSLKQGSNITISQDSTEITISSTGGAASEVTYVPASGGNISSLTVQDAITELDTEKLSGADNIGTGIAIAAGVVGTDLQLKTIAGEGSITVSTTLDTITISSPPKVRQVVDIFTAEINLQPNKVVVLNLATEKLIYADPLVDLHADRVIGITLASIEQDMQGEVLEYGMVSNSGWSWDTNNPIFLGPDGDLTQIVPVTGNLVVMAKTITPTDILVCPQMPILVS